MEISSTRSSSSTSSSSGTAGSSAGRTSVVVSMCRSVPLAAGGDPRRAARWPSGRRRSRRPIRSCSCPAAGNGRAQFPDQPLRCWTPVTATDVFPELEHERARLVHARASRDRMIERLRRVDPDSTADAITAEYVEMTVWEALESLRSPGAGEFFGRIDTTDGPGPEPERWYIGRRHIEDDNHDPVVVDWR